MSRRSKKNLIKIRTQDIPSEIPSRVLFDNYRTWEQSCTCAEFVICEPEYGHERILWVGCSLAEALQKYVDYLSEYGEGNTLTLYTRRK